MWNTDAQCEGSYWECCTSTWLSIVKVNTKMNVTSVAWEVYFAHSSTCLSFIDTEISWKSD